MPQGSKSTATLTRRLKRAQQLAHNIFGFEQLSAGQEEALRSLLDGRDTVAILPTGGGKSAIYQLAGLIVDGPTVVVSPLIALQKDQVDHITEAGSQAELLNSSLSRTARQEVLQGVAEGHTDFLLLAPEQFSNEDTLAQLKAAKPALFVVDEAHCVSHWGHDFRPDFLRLRSVIEELGRPPVLALTATASPPVRAEIVERLGLEDPHIVVAGFDRPNLHLEVRGFDDCERKTVALLNAVCEGPKPAIIYAATREKTEKLAEELTSRGHQALPYHAGMGKAQRNEHQSQFMSGEVDIIVATIAFGMGVDKADVRRVWHHDVSDSLDSYYQEAGRAGRDGAEAEAILFYCPADLGLKKFQVNSGATVVGNATKLAAVIADLYEKTPDNGVEFSNLQKELDISVPALKRALSQLEEVGAVEMKASGTLAVADEIDPGAIGSQVKQAQEKAHDWEKSRLEMMRLYAEESGCRKQFLLGYFGEEMPHSCGMCDNCERAQALNSNREQRPEDVLLPFPLGSRVRHKSWGEGQVLRYDNDAMTVVFDDSGYKTLAVDLVCRNALLEAI